MTSSFYLNPKGMLSGRTALQARKDGHALPLAGQDRAFSLVEVIQRDNGVLKKKFYSTRQIGESTESALQEKLALLTAKRQSIGRLSFERPLIMGVLNVTPDSFSDGGQFDTIASAVAEGYKMYQEGADIIDVGGESTRPGAIEVARQTELDRVLPVLSGLDEQQVLCSIDSRHALVMEAALKAGASILNDVTALEYDTLSVELAKNHGGAVILMHSRVLPNNESVNMKDNPTFDNVALDIIDYLSDRIKACEAAGIHRNNLIIDPGIGFGKTLEDNLVLLRDIGLFHGLGVPIMVGLSRKRFIGELADVKEPRKRDIGSVTLSLEMVQQGVQIVRVHNVSAMRQALDCSL